MKSNVFKRIVSGCILLTFLISPISPLGSVVTAYALTTEEVVNQNIFPISGKTTANLNLRSGAGSTNASIGTIPNGTVVAIMGYEYNDTTCWYNVVVLINGVEYTGYSSSAYITVSGTHEHTSLCYGTGSGSSGGEAHTHTGSSSLGTGCYAGGTPTTTTCGQFAGGNAGTGPSGEVYAYCSGGCGTYGIVYQYHIIKTYPLTCGKEESSSGTHFHNSTCYFLTTCTSSTCRYHQHTGSKYHGTGCYTGPLVPTYNCGTYEYDGRWYSSSYMDECWNCGAEDVEYEIVWHDFYCNQCNELIQDYEATYPCCGYYMGYNDYEGETHIVEAHYELSCGFDGKYVNGGVVCTICGGDNIIYNLTCQKTEPPVLCDKVVIGLIPTSPTQTINLGDDIDLTATARFLDGHTETVTCSITYNNALFNTAQAATLSYGDYSIRASNAVPFTTTISLTINGEFQLTVTSEDTNKGTVSNSSGKVLCNKEVSIEAYPKSGYSFAGWYNGSTKVSTANPYTFNMPAEDTTYTAKFTTNYYTLTVVAENSDFGSVTGGGSKQYGSSVTVKATPISGYKFVGWYDGTTSKSTNATYTFNMPYKDYTLTAKFAPVTMTVSFSANGGTVSPTTKTVTFGDIYGVLPTPVKSGYTFMGWQISGTTTLVSAGTAVKQTGAHTLVAQWGDIGVASMIVTYDKLYADLPNPVRPGYTFNGWYFNEINNNGSGATDDKLKSGDIVKITEQTTVYANWTPKQYTITFDPNGGAVSPATKSVTYDKYYGILPVPTKSGFTFTGWYPSEANNNGTGTPIKATDIVDILDNQTFYAGWTKDPVSVTVTFDPCGGTASSTSKVVTYPGTYGTLPTVTRTGYTFKGWYTAASGGTKVTASSSVIGGYPHTFYAQWTASATYSLTVKGSLEGGTATTSLSNYATFDVSIDGTAVSNDVSSYSKSGYVYGTKYTISDVDTKTGYTFTGFTTAGSGSITSNTVVVLNFKRNTYTLTLDYNGGVKGSGDTSPYTMTYKGGSFNDISWGKPTRTGYTFTGWYTSPTGGIKVYGSDGVCVKDGTYFNSSNLWIYPADVTLYAQWSPSNYTVTFNPNDGNVSETSRLVQYDALYEKDMANGTTKDFPVPTKAGYVFTGWYTASSGGTLVVSKDTVKTAKDHTLYAHWKENIYTVALDQQDATTPGTISVQATYSKAMPTPITLPVKKYTVNFNGNGGTSAKTSLTATHTFNGYFSQKYGNGTKYYAANGSSAKKWDVTSDMTLYASWTETSITLPNVTRPGYTFLGWYKDKNGGDCIGLAGETYAPKNDITVYANWAPLQFTVTFDSNGGVVNLTSKVVEYDQKYGELPTPTRTGYEFTGWYTAKTGGTKITADNVVSLTTDLALYAQWSSNPVTLNINTLYTYDDGCKEHETCIDNKGYTVATFDVYINGACVANDVSDYNKSVSYDDTYEIKDVKVKSGYKYNGARVGYTYNGYSGKDVVGTLDDYDSINGKVYVWLDFKPITYTGTINLNNGTAPEGAPSSYDLSFHQSWNTAIFVPTRVGYTFTGWWTVATNGTNLYDTAGKQINDGTYWKSGYWHYAGDVALHAQWKANTYTLAYNVKGNKASATTDPVHDTPPTTATYDKSFTVKNPTRVGYTFLGWEITGMDTICVHAYDSKTTTADTISETKATSFKNLRSTAGTVTFTAQWENNSYKLTLDPNTGVSSPKYTEPLTVVFDTSNYFSEGSYNPSKVGYTFTGWWTAPSGGIQVYTEAGVCTNEGTYWKNNKWCYTGDVTLYAQWSPNPYMITINGNKGTGSSDVTIPDTTVKVTFDSKDHAFTETGASAETIHVNYLAKNLAERKGYELTGYFTAASEGIKLYDGDGSLAANTIADERVTNPTGYYFYDGVWKVPGNLTVYAQWSPITYTVTLNLNDTGAMPAAKIAYGSVQIIFDTSGHIYGGSSKTDYLASNLPTRVGYTFDGWYTAASGGVKVYNADGSITKEGTYFDSTGRYIYSSNVTLYAHWKANNYELTLDGNKGDGTTEVTVPYSVITMTYDSINHKYNGSNHIDYLAGNLASRIGYIFQGYFTATKNGTKIYNADGSLASDTITDTRAESLSGYYFHSGKWKVAGNLTLYAQWKAKEYTVALNGRGALEHPQESVVQTYDKYGPDVIVPTKTGYTFMGYFTGVRGSGTQYYDGDGKSVKTWTEDTITELYAYWSKDPIVWPEQDPDNGEQPELYPEDDVVGDISRDDAKVLLYADDYNGATGALSDMQPYLTYDTPGSEGAIPSTEQIAIRARMGSWMLSYQFRKQTDVDKIRIRVTVPYVTQYEKDNEDLVISGIQYKTLTIPDIPKAWSYWEIVQSGMYYPDKLTVKNDAIEGSTVVIDVDRAGSYAAVTPAYDAIAYGDKKNHVLWEHYDSDGVPYIEISIPVTNAQYIISNEDGKISDSYIESYLQVVCENAAWNDEFQVTTRSDRFEFDGVTLLSDKQNTTGAGESPKKEELPVAASEIAQTAYSQTYKSGVGLDKFAANGTYETTAVITYIADSKNIGTALTKDVSVLNKNKSDLLDQNINDLKIHTPVVCDGLITNGATIVTDDSGNYISEIVLDEPLNFFTVRVSNVGSHIVKVGYGHRDFLLSLSGGSNVATMSDGNGGTVYRNEVMFPFDIYVDMGNDSLKADGTYDTTGDKFYSAGSWLTVSNQDKVFYVPASQADGDYTVYFRTVAVNCTDITSTQMHANTDVEAYVAVDALRVRLALPLVDFRITNTTDPVAKKELEEGSQALMLKKGYKFGFMLPTYGMLMSDVARVSITPKYYYISGDGLERTEVNLYYNETIDGKKRGLVLAGSPIDAVNMHKVKNDSDFLNIPKALLEETGSLLGLSNFIGSSTNMYTFGGITLGKYVRMFNGIDTTGLPIECCTTCHRVYRDGESHCSHNTVSGMELKLVADKLAQSWYGEFTIPVESYVVPKDTKVGYCDVCKGYRYVTGNRLFGSCNHALSNLEVFDLTTYAQLNTISGEEEFFKKDGYLAVSFDIKVTSDSDREYRFTDWENTELYADFSANARYVPGDVIWYDLSKSAGDDYEVGGVE